MIRTLSIRSTLLGKFHFIIIFLGGECAVQHVGILVPRPGFKPVPPAVEAQSLNHWTAREVQENFKYAVQNKISQSETFFFICKDFILKQIIIIH